MGFQTSFSHVWENAEGGDHVKLILNNPVWGEIGEDFLEKVMARHGVLKDHGWPNPGLSQ